jgi:hypothetical protein
MIMRARVTCATASRGIWRATTGIARVQVPLQPTQACHGIHQCGDREVTHRAPHPCCCGSKPCLCPYPTTTCTLTEDERL